MRFFGTQHVCVCAHITLLCGVDGLLKLFHLVKACGKHVRTLVMMDVVADDVSEKVGLLRSHELVCRSQMGLSTGTITLGSYVCFCGEHL